MYCFQGMGINVCFCVNKHVEIKQRKTQQLTKYMKQINFQIYNSNCVAITSNHAVICLQVFENTRDIRNIQKSIITENLQARK